MTEYALYLECGPRQRKTMVHVLDLLGCISKGPTTELALAETPAAIQSFRAFEERHSSSHTPLDSITFRIVERISEGPWLGYGDPVSGFAPDFGDLRVEDLQTYLRRLKGMEEDILKLVGDVSPEMRAQIPANGGRTINAILMHLAEGQAGFLRYLVGKSEDIADWMRIVRREPDAIPACLAQIWVISNERLAGLSETERSQRVQHGQVTWTARRALRRMLEHTWDMSNELASLQRNDT